MFLRVKLKFQKNYLNQTLSRIRTTSELQIQNSLKKAWDKTP